MLSMVYGSAFQSDVGADVDTSRIRVYRNGGNTYVGHETTDIVHVCDEACMFQVIDDDMFAPADNDSRVFVSVSTRNSEHVVDNLTYVDTIDVVEFDPGDDTYILCGACGAELLRDDERHFAEYGHHIGEGV